MNKQRAMAVAAVISAVVMAGSVAMALNLGIVAQAEDSQDKYEAHETEDE